MNRSSKRFSPNKWMERLVPVILAVLALALVATLVIIMLAVFHILPGT